MRLLGIAVALVFASGFLPTAGAEPASEAGRRYSARARPPSRSPISSSLRLRDETLYRQPIAITGGLLADAGATLSIALAREGGDLLDFDRRGELELMRIPGFRVFDEDLTYAGLHTYTRYLVARETRRRLVLRAVAPEQDWTELEPIVKAAMDTLRADPRGPLGPAPPAPNPVAASTAPEAQASSEPEPRDETPAYHRAILARAASMLGTPYVWGGNVPGLGRDCSAYVSRAWGVARHTTDSIWMVSQRIAKEELLPGDALNLTSARDPKRFGHIVLFEAWANEAHTLI